jgi:2-polyprenyl-3-methyl-5-hydroxy-6-metoxy-1,4-benzoquinol methylase
VSEPRYNYDQIPLGFYDQVLRGGNPVRRLWHLSKFERVLDCLPKRGYRSLLDIGCFSGSFLSLVPQEQFPRQLGIDILPEQIDYARVRYGTPFREFRHVPNVQGIDDLDETFDCITLIEVIEHLRPDEIQPLLASIARKLNPRGRLVVTTPNYASTWPLLEVLLNRVSEVKYEEQHITKFTYFNFERKLAEIYPDLFREFSVEFKTSSHLLTPFLAGASFAGARSLSRLVPHKHWRQPFGNLVLMVMVRNVTAAATPEAQPLAG